jgi:1-deoxy-D-xylulose-5-phosphate reductoisomerase
MPAVLNAANEVCVEGFLSKEMDFISIPKIIEKVLGRHSNVLNPDLGAILEADAWAREEAYKIMERLN